MWPDNAQICIPPERVIGPRTLEHTGPSPGLDVQGGAIQNAWYSQLDKAVGADASCQIEMWVHRRDWHATMLHHFLQHGMQVFGVVLIIRSLMN